MHLNGSRRSRAASWKREEHTSHLNLIIQREQKSAIALQFIDRSRALTAEEGVIASDAEHISAFPAEHVSIFVRVLMTYIGMVTTSAV